MNEQPCFEKVAAAGGFNFHNCSRKVAVVRDGKSYCKIHDPVYVAEKWAKKHAEWDAEAKFKEEKWALQVAAVGSYKKHCGEKARELAEADLLGEALVTLRELMNAARNYEVARTTAGKHGYQEAVERWTSADLSAASLLAKLPKESK